jgi:hypothetical protein
LRSGPQRADFARFLAPETRAFNVVLEAFDLIVASTFQGVEELRGVHGAIRHFGIVDILIPAGSRGPSDD